MNFPVVAGVAGLGGLLIELVVLLLFFKMLTEAGAVRENYLGQRDTGGHRDEFCGNLDGGFFCSGGIAKILGLAGVQPGLFGLLAGNHWHNFPGFH